MGSATIYGRQVADRNQMLFSHCLWSPPLSFSLCLSIDLSSLFATPPLFSFPLSFHPPSLPPSSFLPTIERSLSDDTPVVFFSTRSSSFRCRIAGDSVRAGVYFPALTGISFSALVLAISLSITDHLVTRQFRPSKYHCIAC